MICPPLPRTAKSSHCTSLAHGAVRPRNLLLDLGAGTELVAQVVHCIEAHRFHNQSVQPQTLKARCLYDADKLDSIGAMGGRRAPLPTLARMAASCLSDCSRRN